MNPLMSLAKMTERSLLLAMLAASAAILAGAYTGQYGFDLYPCELCLYQRYPYMAIILLCGAGVWLVKSPVWRWRIAVLCAALFLLDAGIAGYHAGVEMQWFPGPSACSAKDTAGMTLEQMREAIRNAPLVSCDQAMAYVLGLSLAAWNALAAFVLSIGSFWVLLQLKRGVSHG